MNPAAEFRFRFQTYTKDDDIPCESEWFQLKADAIRCGKRELVRQFTKFGKDDLIVKVFNEMNSKQQPIIITLEDALKP